MEPGERLRLCRAKAGIQQSGIPGYSGSYVSRVESGGRPGGAQFWRAAAAALGVSEQWLRSGTDDSSLELADAQKAVSEGDPAGLGALRSLLAREGLAEETRDQASSTLVDALMRLGRYAEAIPLLRSRLGGSAQDPLRECSDRMRLGRCLAESGDLHAAVDACQPMIDVIERLELQRTVPAIQLKVTLAGILTMRGDLVSAQGILSETALDAAVSGSDTALASVMWNSAHLARERGALREAQQLARRAVQLFDDAGELHRYAATLVVWADVALDSGSLDLDEIEQALTRGMDLLRQYGDAVELGYAWHDLSRLRALQDRPGEALDAVTKALVSLGPDHPLETVRCLVTRASLRLSVGDVENAGEDARHARGLLVGAPANYRTRRLWTKLAEDYYTAVGDLEGAIACYRNAVSAGHNVEARTGAQAADPAMG